MKALILVLTLTLVGCHQQDHQGDLNQNKAATYDYESAISTKFLEKGVASAGVKVKCQVEIFNIAQDQKALSAHSWEVYNYNGIDPRHSFIPAPKLTEWFEKQTKDTIVTFQHRNGHVENIMAPAHTKESVIGLVKGILSIFENTLKTDEKSYTLRENGIAGKCNTTYLIRSGGKADEILMTKSKDLNDCDNKVLKVVGAAYATPCRLCKQKTEHFRATSTSNYRIKRGKERMILQADVLEIRQVTPFNELTGRNVLMEARQKMVFIGSQDRLPHVPSDLKKFGSLHYKFDRELPPLPVQLLHIKNRERAIEDGLHYLAEHPNEKLPNNKGLKMMQVTQLLRDENDTRSLGFLFEKYHNRPQYRSAILDLISAVCSPNAIKFLRHKIDQQEITSIEATETLFVFFHFCPASQEVVEEAMLIVTNVLKGPNTLHHKITCLAYGALLNRYCSAADTCPDKYIKPLTDFATKATRASDVEGIVLALKTYGNVGDPAVLKPIMKCMPAASSSRGNFRIWFSGMLALRNVGKKDPLRVQAITLQEILNRKTDSTLRIAAMLPLFESKPSLPVLMTLVNSMPNEPSMQVVHFVCTYLSAMARCTAPDLQVMASASRMALKVLRTKLEQPSYRFSRAYMLGYFKESFMAGVATKAVFIHKEGTMIPMFAMAKVRANILGNTFAPLEVGIGGQEIPHILQRVFAASRSGIRFPDSKELTKSPFDQKIMGQGPDIGGGYFKMFDQEVMFQNLKHENIQELFQANHEIKKYVDLLKNHQTFQWDKNLMSAEIHRVEPTCTGLPLQISLVHVAQMKITGNVQLSMTPEPTSHWTLPDLINTNIKLKTRLNLSLNKDMILTMGIITPEMQAVLEQNVTLAANVPVNVDVAVNIKEKNFKLELPPCRQETDIISLRTKTSAVTRNIEEAPATKSTPVFLPDTMSKVMQEPFDSASEELDKRKDTISSENIHSAGQSKHHIAPVHHTECFEACTYGCKACVEWSNTYPGCSLGDPLYSIVGEHALRLTLKQADARAPIEKLKFIVQGGAHAGAQIVRLLRNEEKDFRMKATKKIYSSSDSSDSSSSDSQDWDADEDINLKQTSVENIRKKQQQDQKHSPGKNKKPFSDHRSSSSDSSSSSSDSSRRSSSSSSSNGSSDSSSSSSDSSRRRSSSSSSSDSSDSSDSSSSSDSSRRRSSSSSSSSSDSSDSSDSSRRRRRSSSSSDSSSGSSDSSSGSSDSSSGSSDSSDSSGSSDSSDSSSSDSSSKRRSSSSSSDSSSSDSSSGSSSSSSSSSSGRYKKGSKTHSSRGNAARGQKHFKKDGGGGGGSSSSSSSEEHSGPHRIYDYENKHSKRPNSKHGSFPTRVQGLQWSTLSFKEYHQSKHPEASSSSSSSSESSSSSSSSRSRSSSRSSRGRKRSSSSSSSDSSLSQGIQSHGDALLPYFTVVAQAVRSDNKDQGYKFSIYMNHGQDKLHSKMVATELAKTKWRACWDSIVSPFKFQNDVSWGNECQDYRIQVKGSSGQVARHTAFQTNLKWTKVPRLLQRLASWAEGILPGTAYISGFTRVYQKNPSREVMLRAIATSPYTAAIVFKVPEETFYKDGLCSPYALPVLPSPYYRTPEINELFSWLANADQAVCEVDRERVLTFDNKIFSISANKHACDLLVVQDCNKKEIHEPEFVIWVTKTSSDLQIHINMTSTYIKISNSLSVLYNGEPILVDRQQFEDDAEHIKMYRNKTAIALEDPSKGLQNVTYNGNTLRVIVSSVMRGNTCGLCGDNNGEIRNEGQMPNRELASSDTEFYRSWFLTDNCVTETAATLSESQKTVAAQL